VDLRPLALLCAVLAHCAAKSGQKFRIHYNVKIFADNNKVYVIKLTLLCNNCWTLKASVVMKPFNVVVNNGMINYNDNGMTIILIIE